MYLLRLTNTALLILYLQVPNIVKAIHRQMKEKSIKTRQGCFALLTELIIVLPGALATHMDQIIPGIQFSLGELQQSLFNFVLIIYFHFQATPKVTVT